MANTQTTVPTFVDGQVLYGAQLNQSAGTGVPVFATTVTRDAGFGGAGEKTLAEGQLCYLESTNVVQYYDGAAWATLAPAPAASSGLTLISTTSAVSTSFTISSCFSSTYDNYLINFSNVNATSAGKFRMRLGSGTAHKFNLQFAGSTEYTTDTAANSGNFFNLNSGIVSAGGSIYLASPFLAAPTNMQSLNNYTGEFMIAQGVETSSTSFTDITFSNQNSATFTSGTIKIYGYANS